MNTTYLTISAQQVLLSSLMVVLAILLSWLNHARLERQYVIGALRSFFQLWLVGYLLFWLFQSRNPLLLLGVVEIMILVAAVTAAQRQKQTTFKTYLALWLALHFSALFLGGFLFIAIFRVDLAEYPHLFIPLMGMVIGNSANGASLALHRLRGEIESHRGEIETALALGATPQKALEPYLAQTMQNALIPMINSMMLMGVVQLPGIMTGQMLSGVIPQEAVRYQIIVLYLLAGAVALTCHLSVRIEARRYFTSRWGLVIEGKNL
ncbi:MAG: iron export ABC transporter permease subunit FetB [Candidatus Omnitrophota bacterium]|jgi:putative ABC transport system permease protein|nr:MAG: iron export ABC transporter permease subunit FetB [Candidatus Omnitrophota bacterium]